MLAKTLKYEFKSTVRLFAFLYLALIVMSAITMIFLPANFADNEMMTVGSIILGGLTSIFTIAYVLLAIAVLVVTEVIIIMRYYRLLGDEGYLWFTLPVTSNQHILAKLIASIVWSIASIAVTLLSILLLTARLGSIGKIIEALNDAASSGFHIATWIILILVLTLVAVISGILNCYAAMSIGPHITKNRLGGSVLGYLIIYVATQILGTVVILIVAFTSNAWRVQMGTFSVDVGHDMTSELIAVTEQTAFTMITWCTVYYAVLAVAFYFISRRFLSKKLNLA